MSTRISNDHFLESINGGVQQHSTDGHKFLLLFVYTCKCGVFNLIVSHEHFRDHTHGRTDEQSESKVPQFSQPMKTLNQNRTLTCQAVSLLNSGEIRYYLLTSAGGWFGAVEGILLS